jgi:methylated-DNA-[protein]-cysteine S-methyltransferase
MDEDDPSGIYARESSYLDRYVQLGIAGDRVVSTSFPQTPKDDAAADHPLLDRIEAYLRGEEDDFADVTIGLTVPTDRRAVLEAAQEIPYGEQLSVGRVIGTVADLDPESDKDGDLVRTALAENPVPLLIPDHRVRDGPSGAPPPVEQRLRSVEGL